MVMPASSLFFEFTILDERLEKLGCHFGILFNEIFEKFGRIKDIFFLSKFH
jgi:hypothetical protein